MRNTRRVVNKQNNTYLDLHPAEEILLALFDGQHSWLMWMRLQKNYSHCLKQPACQCAMVSTWWYSLIILERWPDHKKMGHNVRVCACHWSGSAKSRPPTDDDKHTPLTPDPSEDPIQSTWKIIFPTTRRLRSSCKCCPSSRQLVSEPVAGCNLSAAMSPTSSARSVAKLSGGPER